MESRKIEEKEKNTRKPNTTLIASDLNSRAHTVLCTSLKMYLFKIRDLIIAS